MAVKNSYALCASAIFIQAITVTYGCSNGAGSSANGEGGCATNSWSSNNIVGESTTKGYDNTATKGYDIPAATTDSPTLASSGTPVLPENKIGSDSFVTTSEGPYLPDAALETVPPGSEHEHGHFGQNICGQGHMHMCGAGNGDLYGGNNMGCGAMGACDCSNIDCSNFDCSTCGKMCVPVNNANANET